MKRYNLLVAGGGLGGVAAAVSAARQGKSVLLIEKEGSLGGAAVNNLVGPFMRYWTHKTFGGREQKILLNRGIFAEILDNLDSYQALDKKNSMCFYEEYLKCILDKMTIDSGVEVLLHSTIISAGKKGNKIISVSVYSKGGIDGYTADNYIDATGDGDLAAMAGCQYVFGREQDGLCQPMTLYFRLGNVDIGLYEEQKEEINDLYKKFQSEGKITNPREKILVSTHLGGDILHFNCTRIIKKNPLNAKDLTFAEIEARKQMLELYDFLRDNFAPFKDSYIVCSAPKIGVRESRKIIGEYILNENDIITCKKFEDSVAAGNYYIDIHNPNGGGTEIIRVPEGDYYTIPYRSIVARDADNLLVSGRCISATHIANSATRIMPICCCIGEAAGLAAVVASEKSQNFRDINVNALQKLLVENNAFIGI